ncbi:MAG: sulfatase [Chthonomonadales bacterium]|nr:sulfatase [Chthonomonadales bacterium]
MALASAGAAESGLIGQRRPTGQRPNILIFHAHDLGQHLGCYGVPTVRTPSIDGFAAQGVRFERSYCTAPSCSPSRASLLTGRYPHCNGVLGLCHFRFEWDLHPNERHLAQLLRDAGYATCAVGVIHETHQKAERWGYEKHIPNARAAQAAEAAIAELERLREAEKPFYLWIGTIEPHRLAIPQEPGQPPGDQGFPGPGMEPDDGLGVYVPPYLVDTPPCRKELAGLQGAVRHVDAQFGRILTALDRMGLADDTLVIFTTDHGIAMPRAKCNLYEPGVSIACILRLPSRAGWHGGIVRREMISNIDMLPTLAEVAGFSVPSSVQGLSFASLLDGREYRGHDAIYTELTYHDYYDPKRAIRTETHKLIANFSTAPAFMDPSQQWRPRSDTVTPPNHATAYHPYLELYDLVADPWEQKDLAEDPGHAGLLKDLAGRLYKHMVATRDPILRGAVTSPHHRRTAEALRMAGRKT